MMVLARATLPRTDYPFLPSHHAEPGVSCSCFTPRGQVEGLGRDCILHFALSAVAIIWRFAYLILTYSACCNDAARAFLRRKSAPIQLDKGVNHVCSSLRHH
jgi:hypothetical protein